MKKSFLSESPSALQRHRKTEYDNDLKIKHKYIITQYYPAGSYQDNEIICGFRDMVFYNDIESAESSLRIALEEVKEENQKMDIILKIIKVEFSEIKEITLLKPTVSIE